MVIIKFNTFKNTIDSFIVVDRINFICRQRVVDFLDLTLFKDLIYVNIALGISFALYSDTAFFILQPMFLFELGFSKVSIE